MRRKIYQKLLAWKNSTRRKPLILKGARQVGKSWILRDFGAKEFESVAYISCDNTSFATSLFSDYDIERILRSVEAITSVKPVAGKTLIIFDEIQEIPAGLTALKYFCEDAPEFHVAVAGSLLGVSLNQGISFPVGKVTFLDMYPMDFEEFLWAVGLEKIAEMIAGADVKGLIALEDKCLDLLRQYYFCGGMPEAVKAYSEGVSLAEVRQIQMDILESYRNDIGKHAPKKDIERIHLVLRSLPAQLAKENKKFIYGAIRKGARAAEFELAIQWLVDAGLVNKVSRINKASLPLPFYEDYNSFKLYFLDCGLYGAMSQTDTSSVLLGGKIFTEYNGAFSELYVSQQLVAQNERLYYFSGDNSRIEIDFIIDMEGILLPIEVKAGGNVKGKSLRNFCSDNNLHKSVRFSILPWKRQETLTNIPLFSAFAFKNYL